MKHLRPPDAAWPFSRDRPGARPPLARRDRDEYAFWLSTCVPETERRPSEALRFARRAVESQANPVFLDTLALAYFQTGAAADAVKTEEPRAGDAAPGCVPIEPTGLRSEIEGHLAQFRAR